MRAFREMVTAYRKRPALGVKTTVTVELAQDDVASRRPEVKAEFLLGRGGVGVVELNGFRCYLSGGTLAAVHESTDDSYYSTPDDDSPYYALMAEFLDIPFPHLALAFGEQDMESLWMQFHQKAPWIQPTGVTTVTKEDRTLRQIKMTSDFDDMTITVDPKTNLIESIELHITGGDLVQPGSTLTYRHEYEYETPDAPLEAAAFALDPGERQPVDMLAALVVRPAGPMHPGLPMPEGGDLVGEPAPALVLATADGGVVDLEALRGRVVVLDFWATWCGPCVRALPLLHQVAGWAQESGLPVEILTVNIWEMVEQPDARLEAVREFWKNKGFTLPVVMDYTDETSAAFRIQAIPVTIIIGPDGIIAARHDGLVPDYIETLKLEITEALGE